MRLFILYNLQLEIINFLYKNYGKAASWLHVELQIINSNSIKMKSL